MKIVSIKSVLVLMMIFFTVSCGDNESKGTQEAKESKKELFYNHENTVLQWTAFKTTDKIAVKGTFNTVIVENKGKGESVEEIINTTSFKIPTSTVFTDNEGRDVLLREYFFGAMMNTDTIYGSFINVKDGKGKVLIKMNEVEAKSDIKYEFVNDSLKVSTILLLETWKGSDALKSLNKVCYDKHTGSDGVSKTWSDVEIDIITLLK
ncbi:MAG: hypothetical protein ABFR62_08510 [Bacteroidota bacterium]